MKIILDRNLVFMQFQNLVILTICGILLELGLLNSTKANEFVFFKNYILLFAPIFYPIATDKKRAICRKT